MMASKRTWLAIPVISAVLASGCTAEQEALSMQQQVEARMQLNNARHESIQQLEDPALAQLLLSEEQNNYYWMLETLAFNSKPYEIEFTQPQLQRLSDYPDIGAMTEAYLQSLLALTGSDYGECSLDSDRQGFRLHEGFAFPFPHHIEYSQMVLDNGEALSLSDTGNGQQQSADVIQRRDSYCFTAPRSESEPKPVTVSAEFFAELPQDVLEFEFSAADVGKSIVQNGYKVTLVELNEYSYVLEVNAADGTTTALQDEHVIAEAVTADGQYIKKRVTNRQRGDNTERVNVLLQDLIARAKKGELELAEARSELASLKEGFAEDQGTALYSAHAFHGPVDKARVTLLVGSEYNQEMQQDLDLPVYAFTPSAQTEELNLDAFPEIALTAPVYNHSTGVRAIDTDLDAQQMATQIEIRQRRIALHSDPSLTFPAQVFLYYPQVQSDLFINIFERYKAPAASDVQFFDEQGTPLTVEADDDSGNKAAFHFTVSRLEYDPDRFSAKPARLKAIIPVLTAPDMIKDSYPKEQLPAGVRLNGNQLIIDYAEFEAREMEDISSRFVERRNQVFVKDSQGYLAEIDNMTLSRQNGQPVDVYYFYGEPEIFEVWYRGETTEVPFALDIGLE
ncbi:hypothetical protein CWE09_07385 [Aliidiomarina minuta]|uniref:Lipoprotein n=1 Tax=Aliidiomarina minuta TaxID=880057 RepID=A0A432W8Y8_9GAMM|nr:hypothetical protein [Aliidiomarina minuta]RUO26521.1 hypothetical protein CWE09_07385 [Aliidiomarina minuta]